MQSAVSIETIYVPSEDIVAREIEGELIIVPIVAGIGDMEDSLFTLNETGKAVWDKLDGKRSLKDVIRELTDAFAAQAQEIEADVIGFMEEVVKRGIVVESGGK